MARVRLFGGGCASWAAVALQQALVDGFLSWIESLIPSETPQADLIVVRDFDPSQDVLVLPVATGVDLSESAPQTFNPDNAGDYRTGIKFFDNTTDTVYAELTLGTDFLASVGLTQDDTDDIARILNFMTANATTMNSDGSFSSLSNVSAKLPDGGFSLQLDAPFTIATTRRCGQVECVAAPALRHCVGFPGSTSGSAPARQRLHPAVRFWGRRGVRAMADRSHRREGQHDERNVAMPAMPGARFVVIEPQLVLRSLNAASMAQRPTSTLTRVSMPAPAGHQVQKNASS